ncbi:MAG: PAS domain S-box protein [Candidatus Aminicenantes bacterium]|nr:PAS domain S-box protein [Candidatus Aminicenantes bacterium]
MLRNIKALIINDSDNEALRLGDSLKKGFNIQWERVTTAGALRTSLKKKTWDVVLSECELKSLNVLDALAIVREHVPDLPFILVCDMLKDDQLLKVIKAGAQDHIRKDQLFRLLPVVERETRVAEKRRQLEETAARLAESEERYRVIFDSSPNGILTSDLKGKILSCNRSFSEITGFKQSDIIGIHFTKLPTLPKKSLKEFIALFADMIRGTIFRNFEFRWVHADGRLRWGQAQSSLIRRKKKIIGVQVILSDITGRKEAELALEESEEKYRRVVEQAQEGIVILQGGLIRFANRGAVEDFGYTMEEVIGSSFSHFAYPGEEKNLLDMYQKQIVGEKTPLFYESSLRSRKGDRVYVEISGGNISYKGEPAVVIVFRDVTELRKAERRIEASLREKEVLLREVHHRVKNNLQIIVSLLSLQAREIDDERVIEWLDESRRRVHSMALVYEILYQSEDFTKVEFAEYIRIISSGLVSGFGIPGRVKMNLDLQKGNLSIEKAIPLGLLLNELITNAFKHAFPDNRQGSISIRFCSLENDTFELVVQDDGIGLPPDIDMETSESLGLRIVRLLTGQLEGNLSVQREKGTTFTLCFKSLK